MPRSLARPAFAPCVHPRFAGLVHRHGDRAAQVGAVHLRAREAFEHTRFQAEEIFIFTDEHFLLEDETRLIDSGMFACIYVDGFDQEIPAARRLHEYCHAHNYAISGDYICEVMTEFNVFGSRERSMFLRLQVPVKFTA